jgi:hypothetical protein
VRCFKSCTAITKAAKTKPKTKAISGASKLNQAKDIVVAAISLTSPIPNDPYRLASRPNVKAIRAEKMAAIN